MAATQAESNNMLTVALIGFGEAGMAFASGWTDEGVGVSVRVFDLKTVIPGTSADEKRDDYRRLGVAGHESAVEAVTGAEAVFSLVTADQAVAAAASIADALTEGTLFLDCNSVAPGTKKKAAEVISAAGGRYVDAAVMAPVHPKRHKTRIFLSGDAAAQAHRLMESLSMNVQVVSDEIGAASSIKLTRSIMMKGLEALMAECVLAGRTLGVEDIVLETLEETYPGFGWSDRAGQMMERMMVHGQRRAAEMREATSMVESLGLPGRMARSTATWEQQVGELRLNPDGSATGERADRLLQALMTTAPSKAGADG